METRKFASLKLQAHFLSFFFFLNSWTTCLLIKKVRYAGFDQSEWDFKYDNQHQQTLILIIVFSYVVLLVLPYGFTLAFIKNVIFF